MAFLSGLSAFPITPASADGHVDRAAFRRLVSRLRAAEVDSIGVLGSTGSYMYLSRDERRRALEAAIDEVAGRIPILAGIGALRTEEAVSLARDARALGATAGLLAPVSYTPLNGDEVFEHFTTVAREGGLPIVIYDNPGTTHFRFKPALIKRLAEQPGIKAIKNPTDQPEAIPAHLAAQRADLPAGFTIGYSGDWNAAKAMSASADTWFSVLAGILPEPCLQITRAAARGDTDQVTLIDAALSPVWTLFRKHSSYRVVHAMAGLLGICDTAPPRPMLPVSPEVKQEIQAVLASLFEVIASD